MNKNLTIKRRRLTAEVQSLSELIEATKAMIKHDPYKEDHDGLRVQLINARADLQQAVNELAEIGREMKHDKRVEAFLVLRGDGGKSAETQTQPKGGWSVKCPQCNEVTPDVRKDKFCRCGIEFYLTNDGFISAIGASKN